MEIRDVHLMGVAQFEEVRLELGTGLHVLYGPNETGKSTLLALLIDLLFGGAPENRAWYEGKSRLSATLVHENETHQLRRKRHRAQLVQLGPDDKPAEEDLMTELFGIERQRYMQLYGFDHHRLRAGGQSLLATDGDASISLFEAGSGSSYVKRWIDAYKARISELFHPAMRANSTALLNRALRDYQACKTRQRQAQLRPSAWLAQQSALQEAELKAEQLHTRIAAAKRELTRMERIRRSLPLFQERQQLVKQLETYADIPTMSDRQERSIRDLLKEMDQLKESDETEQSRLERLQAKLQEMKAEDPILHHASALEALREEFALYRSTAEDLPSLRESLSSGMVEIEALGASLFPDGWQYETPVPVLTHSTRQTLQELAESAQKSLQQKERVSHQLTEAQAELTLKRETLQQQPEPRDVTALRARMQTWRNEGVSEQKVAKLKLENTTRKRDLQTMVSQQDVWEGEPEQILTLPIPALETVQRYAEAMNRLERARETAAEALEQATATVGRLETDLANLQSDGWLPTEDDLKDARRHRDEGWHLIKSRLKNPAVITLDAAAYSNGVPSLEDAYEQAYQHADRTVDKLRMEAQRIAKRNEYLAQLEGQRKVCRKRAEELQQLQEHMDQLEAEWRTQWDPCGLQPKHPVDMQAWLQQWFLPFKRELADAQRLTLEWESALLGLERAEAELASWGQLYGISVPSALQTFDDRIVYIDAELTTVEHAQMARAALVDGVEQAERKVQQYETQLNIHEQTYLDVMAKYEQLRLEHPFLPADINGYSTYRNTLDKFVEMLSRYRKDERLQEEKGELVKRFEERVLDIGTALLGERADRRDAPMVYHQLQLRLKEAKSQQSERERHETLVTTQQERVETVRAALRRVELQVQEWTQTYHQNTVQGLLTVLDTAAQKRACAGEIERVKAAMVVTGDGHSLQEILEELGSVEDIDAIPSQVSAIRTDLAELESQLSECQVDLGQKKQAFAQMDGSMDDAAKAAQEAAMASETVQSYWEELVRMQTELTLLEQALSVYRDQNQSGMIDSAGQIFQRITQGRYVGLELDDDPSAPHLLAIHTDGMRRTFGELSDGTMDQLHFALRLAFLKAQADGGGGMPLIMDDVFVHFDDERTAATLEVLDEVASHVQILYFTHHRHLIEQVLPNTTLRHVKTHELAQEIRYRKG